jgi:hypothetical protein
VVHTTKSERKQVKACRVAALSFPLSFAALTGRSGHGLARASRLIAAYLLGLQRHPRTSDPIDLGRAATILLYSGRALGSLGSRRS